MGVLLIDEDQVLNEHDREAAKQAAEADSEACNYEVRELPR